MLIVADDNIPLLDNFFGDMGEVRRVPGRQMTAADVAEADVLLVRSVTRVNRDLLQGSKVRFVGTATIGTDHIDRDWLQNQGIAFSSAPGCNAQAVVEYVLSGLSLYLERTRQSWDEISVGIVGCGNVGSRLRHTLSRLGTRIRVSDPPRAETGEDGFDDIEEVLACDVVTLHTPLTETGPHPTRHLINADRLHQFGHRQLLINTCRGPVVDNQALIARMQTGQAPMVVLDVWEGEPAISRTLANLVWLGTPHIAGYSLEGKVNGTEMIYRALCQHLGQSAHKHAEQFLPPPPLRSLGFCGSVDPVEAMHTAIRAAYDVRRDDLLLRDCLAGAEDPVLGFDALRRNYRVRREFSSVKVNIKGPPRCLQNYFLALGFKVRLSGSLAAPWVRFSAFLQWQASVARLVLHDAVQRLLNHLFRDRDLLTVSGDNSRTVQPGFRLFGG